jgi:glycosyltransferase involved in cell wall biosynthesis
MKLQLLVLTQPSRYEMLKQLVGEFDRQGGEPLIHMWDKSLDLGHNRNALMDHATAEYVMFFDDDDWPAHDFIETIVPLLDGVDYVGYKLQCWCQHLRYQEYGDTDHSLKYPDWSREGMKFFRDISHVNPMRRELAMQAKFDGGFGEDHRWAQKIRNLGIVKTQNYIPRVMYHYIWRAVKHDDADYCDPYRLQIINRVRSGRWARCTCGRHCDGVLCVDSALQASSVGSPAA